jgi:type II secretion system protein C
MRVHTKDFIWIASMAAVGLTFLNIFVAVNFQRIGDSHRKRDSHQFQQVRSALEIGDSHKKRDSHQFPNDAGSLGSQESRYAVDLPFELRGTIINSPAVAAIYNSETKTQRIYKVNDLIEEYKIVNIASGKVSLEKNGVMYELLLTGFNRGKTVRMAGDKGSELILTPSSQVVTTERDGTMAISKRGVIAQLPKANELLAKLKILPLAEASSNKLKGFRIDNVPSGSIVDEAGIKNGDIICSIQGQELQSMKDAWQAFDKIKTQPQFEVVVLRANVPVKLKYRMRN